VTRVLEHSMYEVQQNSFNLKFNNSDNPVLKKISPKNISFDFYQYKVFMNETGRSQGTFKKPPRVPVH